MAKAVGINHVALEVGDVDEALAFYGGLVDVELRGGAGGAMAFVALGDQFVALASAGERHVGLVVDDRQAVLDRARAAGAHVDGHQVRDPWGNVVEVVAYADVQYTKPVAVLNAMGLRTLTKTAK